MVDRSCDSLIIHLPIGATECDDVGGSPEPPGGHVHHCGLGVLLWCETEAQLGSGELPRCPVHLQRKPGEWTDEWTARERLDDTAHTRSVLVKV